MKITPLNDWAVIVPSEAETRTTGGLYIPDSAKEKPAEGVVEAIGPGALEEEGYGKKKKKKEERKFIATSVKPGERVLYEAYAGQKITLGGNERVLVRERDILGIMPPQQARPKEDLPPLQIPSVTTSSSSTAIAKRPVQTAVVTVAQKRTAQQSPVKKAAKKAAPKKTAPKKKAAAAKPAKTKKASGAKSKGAGRAKKKK